MTRPTAICERPPAATKRFLAALETQLRKGQGVISTLPFDRCVFGGSVQRESYVRYLQITHQLRTALTGAVAQASHLSAVRLQDFLRQSQVLSDLKAVGGRVPVRSSDLIDQFDGAARAWAQPPGKSLIGVIFAFELERRRLAMAAPELARALGLRTAAGTRGLVELDDRHFHSLRRWIDSNVISDRDQADVGSAAVTTLKFLIEAHRLVG